MRIVKHASVLPLLALVASSASFAACAQEETAASDHAWSCGKEDVPGGEAVRCVQSAMMLGGPSDPSGGAGSEADAGTGSTGGTSYDCAADSTSPDCPPSDGSLGSQTGSGSNGGSGSESSDECGYAEDLPYCNPSSSTADGGTTTDGGDTSECTEPKCKAPGQEKKGSSQGQSGENSSGGATGGEKPNGSTDHGSKKPSHCTKDSEGNKSCLSEPTCPPGSHAAPCGACVTDDESSSDCVPPDEGGCWVTGGGFIEAESLVPAAPVDGHDNYGGNAKPMKDGTVKGHWNHVDHGTGNHALGRPEYLFCRHVDEPGPGQPGGKKGLTSNQVYFGGHARWRSNDVWEDGYWFDVVAKDHGEPGSVAKPAKNGGMVDTYHFTIRKIVDPTNLASGTVVYETKGDLEGGNIQIHPSNGGHPGVQSPLPSWVSLEP